LGWIEVHTLFLSASQAMGPRSACHCDRDGRRPQAPSQAQASLSQTPEIPSSLSPYIDMERYELIFS